jgi:diguanylate cyclase (GGDEF)-like protein
VLRFGDNAARIGGDEFALILPSTDPEAVPPLLERIGAAPGERACPAFSYGVAQCPTEAETTAELLDLADRRLYEAKAARREVQ